MPASKKYKLLKASDGEKLVCAFFSSPDGCRNGDRCAFRHGPEVAASVAGVCESTSVISSEESEAGQVFQPKNTLKVKHDDHGSDPFAQGDDLVLPQAHEQPNPKKRKNRSSIKGGDDLFAKPKQNNIPSPPKKIIKVSESPKPGIKQRAQMKRSDLSIAPSGPADFRSLISRLPVASFSVPLANSVRKGPHTPANGQQKRDSECGNNSVLSSRPEEILPTSTEEGRKWLKAVQCCRRHERYASSFDFVRYKEINKEAGITAEWIKARPFGDWCSEYPQAVAIDCEMCETQDPLSGAKNPKALCRISVINAQNPDEVLLDTLVKPAWPVTDYRTRINGIGKDDLANVEFTLRHAQAFMMALCSSETVIVGHAVQNDLAALFMEHYCVADSSFLFFAKDSTTSSVSLKDLVSSIFETVMPDTHDSVNDARKALDCVRHWVEKDGDVVTIERTAKYNGNQLFLHRIPKQCKIHHLTSMFVKHTSIEPSMVDEIEFSGESGKTHATFRSTRHASLAFDSLEGTAELDKSGRPQKKVYLRNGDYVRVRKMIHNHRAGTPTKATPAKK
jgi:RNA exonuclease 1